MTPGTMRRDPATGVLLLDGVPVCAGCLDPSSVRFCSDACEKKVARESKPSPRRRRTDRAVLRAPAVAV